MTKLAEKLRTDLPYVARAGRVSYYVDFTSIETDYSRKADRKRVNEGANCWSSECRMLPDYHMPCFDVDIEPSRMVSTFSYPDNNRPVPEEHHLTVKVAVEAWMKRLCGDAEVRWVPSTTPGHHHVYVDYPVEWGPYAAALECMTRDGIVERGYLVASVKRKGTYVRMPGVLKEDPSKETPPEQFTPNDDMEPF